MSLPTVGGSTGTWGTELNDWLLVDHNTDGTNIGGGGGGGAAEDITNTPAGDISATNVQDALNQLDTNKVDSGDVLSPDGATLEQSGATLRVRQPISTFLEFAEMADASAPSANRSRLYTRDNGAGKTQLVVRFPSGAVQVIATEP